VVHNSLVKPPLRKGARGRWGFYTRGGASLNQAWKGWGNPGPFKANGGGHPLFEFGTYLGGFRIYFGTNIGVGRFGPNPWPVLTLWARLATEAGLVRGKGWGLIS